MSNKTMSDNACYVCSHMAVPLSFNNVTRFLGFQSAAYSDVTRIKYRFYHFKGLYWYCIILDDGHVANSLFFVGLSNCVRDFRSLCDAMDWSLEDSSDLAEFVSQFNKANHERGA